MRKLKLTTLYCTVFILASLSTLEAQQIFKTTTSSVIPFYEYLPEGYDSNSDKYPVVIFLHGIGERGPNTNDVKILKNNIYKVARHGPPKHIKNGATFPFILISPQLKDNNRTWPPAYVMEVINHIKSQLRIDERRIYLTGLSLGGGGVWMTAQDYASMFAAIAPVCGGYNTPSKACNLADEKLPVWAFHGNRDSIVPISKSAKMVNAVNACATRPDPLAKFTIYPGIAHDSWDYAYATDHSAHNPNVYEWLLQFTNTTNAGNNIPTANAGDDQVNIITANTVDLTGSGADKDGSIASYTWTKMSGPTATLSNTASKTVTISNLKEGIYIFRLQVKDNDGNTDSDYVKVTINTAPI